MKKASYIFEVIRERLHSAEFLKICRRNPHDFTRTRLLTCQVLILFILNLLKESIPKELISFCKFCKIASASRSAVTQARAKLSSEAFIDLNDVLIKEFYTENELRTLHGFIVLGIDGSTFQLPINSPEILEKYGFASNQTDTKVPMGRTSHLYDLVNGLTIDAALAPYSVGERDLAIGHFERLRKLLSPKDLQRILVIFDRGYPSAALIVYLTKYGINFLMRCSKKFIKEIDRAVATGKEDVIVSFSVNRGGQAREELKKLFPNLDKRETISVRVITVTLKTGEKEILITSLLDTIKYPYQIFSQLYFKRWGIEENYKFYKIQLEIENFSGTSCHVVEQDFHATILAANARALLAVEAANERATHQANVPDIDQKKYIYEINKKISMVAFKDEFVAVLLDPDEDIELFCFEVKKIMKLNLVPIRPNRLFRRSRKHPHHKYSMNMR